MRLLAVNALLLVAGIAALELLFGSWIRDNRIQQLNLVRDQSYRYDVSSLYDNGGEVIEYRRDSFGLRGDYESPDTIGILTVGGSTTDQKYVGEGATWQDQLRDRFADSGQEVSVVNAGVDGHSTVGHLRSFDWWFPTIPGLAPRYVLFFVGINDIHVESQRTYDMLVNPDAMLTWADTIRERSGLYYMFRTLRGMYRAEARGVGHRRVDFATVNWVDAPLRRNHAERSAARRHAYAQRLRKLAEKTRALGAEPIFVTQLLVSSKRVDGSIVGVDTSGSNGVDVYIVTSLFNETTMETCRAVNAICVDLGSELKDAFTDQDFYDFSHTTPSGAARIGEYLHRSLETQLDFD